MGESLAATDQVEQAVQAFELARDLIKANYDQYQHLLEPTEIRLRNLNRVTDHARG